MHGARVCTGGVTTSLKTVAVAVATWSKIWACAAVETARDSGWARARPRSPGPDMGVRPLSLIV